MKKRIWRLTPQQWIVVYYIIAMLVSFLLLRLPYVHKPGVHVSYVDSMFLAVSGISVTGLAPMSIVDTYSLFGQVIILIVLNIGGLGVMAMGTLVWVILGKRIGMQERRLIMVDNNQEQMTGVVQLLKEIVKVLLTIEAVGALLLAFYFYKDMHSVKEALYQGLFASVAATTNGVLTSPGRLSTLTQMTTLFSPL